MIWLRAIAWFWSCIAIFAGVRSVTFDGNAPAVPCSRPRSSTGMLRLVDQRRVVWQNRGQFFGVAAQMMRRILVDRARARKMAKRSGQWVRVTVDDAARATRP